MPKLDHSHKQLNTGKTVVYDLHVKDTLVNFTGKNRKGLAINGSIPAPTLYFQVGDTAVIRVHNHLQKQQTSTHWHGLLLPNEQDGVPYLTTAPIEPNTTHTFRFPITHAGTYWYHSHTMFQEQLGLYGSIVIDPQEQKDDIKEQVLILSDWTDENPKEVMRSLKVENDWYAIKKNAVQSWGEAISKGGFSAKLKQSMSRMPPMDIADVYYPKFLVNGTDNLKIPNLKAGDQIKLRIINGSASSYFYLNFSGGEIEVIEADGVPVVPVRTNEVLIATAETYDVILTVPDNRKYEFQITAQDSSGKASVWLGDGQEVKAKEKPKLDYIQMMKDEKHMNMDGSGEHSRAMQMSKHAMGETKMEDKDWSYDRLMSKQPTKLPVNAEWREVHLNLTGNMNRYIWSFNDKTLSEEDQIHIKKGENVRFILHNKTMMNHPLHLHGHFFRLVNQHGDYSPLKHTFTIQPMETRIIEFEANEEKDWFFHCHILYHMIAGMARVVHYENSPVNEQVPNREMAMSHLKKEDQHWYFTGETAIHTQANSGMISFFNKDYSIDGEWRVNWRGDYETETHLVRYLGKKQFLKAVLGSDIRLREVGLANTKDNRQVFHVGMQYTLPLFIDSEIRLDHTGNIRFQLSHEDVVVSNRVRLNWMVNTDQEYQLGLKYIIAKNFAISGNYDSDFGYGGGLTITY